MEVLVIMKALIAYFSRAVGNYCSGKINSLEEGNTAVVAQKIALITGGELFRIRQAVPYSDDYDTCLEESKEDKEKDARPEIVDCITSIDEYDTIFIGYPNYWGSMPRVMFTFLEKFDFSEKIIYPFCTHEGSGFGNTISELKARCEGAVIKDGFLVVGSTKENYNEELRAWIEDKKSI